MNEMKIDLVLEGINLLVLANENIGPKHTSEFGKRYLKIVRPKSKEDCCDMKDNICPQCDYGVSSCMCKENDVETKDGGKE